MSMSNSYFGLHVFKTEFECFACEYKSSVFSENRYGNRPSSSFWRVNS